MRGGRSFYEKIKMDILLLTLIVALDLSVLYAVNHHSMSKRKKLLSYLLILLLPILGGYLLLCFLLSQKVISGCRSADICVKFPGLVRGRKTLPIERVSSMGRTGWFIRKRWVTLTVAFFRTDRWCIPYMI